MLVKRSEHNSILTRNHRDEFTALHHCHWPRIQGIVYVSRRHQEKNKKLVKDFFRGLLSRIEWSTKKNIFYQVGVAKILLPSVTATRLHLKKEWVEHYAGYMTYLLRWQWVDVIAMCFRTIFIIYYAMSLIIDLNYRNNKIMWTMLRERGHVFCINRSNFRISSRSVAKTRAKITSERKVREHETMLR